MYKFGGKELQNEFGVEMYDFGAKNYTIANAIFIHNKFKPNIRFQRNKFFSFFFTIYSDCLSSDCL